MRRSHGEFGSRIDLGDLEHFYNDLIDSRYRIFDREFGVIPWLSSPFYNLGTRC